jgi:L-xylulokinase
MRYVVGLDAGLTVTKAVVFDENGTPLGGNSVRVPTTTVRERWVERDAETLWLAAAEAICGAIARSGIWPDEIVAVGVTGHGDGLYLVDEAGLPTRAGVTSLDTRAQPVVDRWHDDGMICSTRPVSFRSRRPRPPSWRG